MVIKCPHCDVFFPPLTTFQKSLKKEDAFLKLRIIRGELMLIPQAIGQFERQDKTRLILDYLSDIEKELEELYAGR